MALLRWIEDIFNHPAFRTTVARARREAIIQEALNPIAKPEEVESVLWLDYEVKPRTFRGYVRVIDDNRGVDGVYVTLFRDGQIQYDVVSGQNHETRPPGFFEFTEITSADYIVKLRGRGAKETRELLSIFIPQEDELDTTLPPDPVINNAGTYITQFAVRILLQTYADPPDFQEFQWYWDYQDVPPGNDLGTWKLKSYDPVKVIPADDPGESTLYVWVRALDTANNINPAGWVRSDPINISRTETPYDKISIFKGLFIME